MEIINRTIITSSEESESSSEDYFLVKLNKIKKKYNLNYLANHIDNNIHEQYFKYFQIIDEGLHYKKEVNKILDNDIFKNFDFYKNKIDFNFQEHYKIDYNLFVKGDFDFFVYKIPINKFFEILNKRKNIMILRYSIPKNIKYITIIGEIKINRYKAYNNDNNQRKDFLTFIDLINDFNKKSNFEELLIMMYIYDISFSIFKNELTDYIFDKQPIIYAYMPKLYSEDCYIYYNEIIELLKSSKEKIDLTITKRQLLNEYKLLLEENKLLLKENKKYKYLLFCLVTIFITFIIINYLYNLDVNLIY